HPRLVDVAHGLGLALRCHGTVPAGEVIQRQHQQQPTVGDVQRPDAKARVAGGGLVDENGHRAQQQNDADDEVHTSTPDGNKGGCFIVGRIANPTHSLIGCLRLDTHLRRGLRMAGTPGLSASDLELLRRYDTPTICNVVELFDLYPRTAGYMDGRIVACYPALPPMVGYASTATFRSASPPRAGNVYSGLDQQVAAFAGLPGPPVVVFQDLDSPPAAATFGEIMCSTYQAFGAVGLITSGAGRDLDQVEKLRFPCFTGGTICAHGYCHIPEINVPVHVGGVTIH